MSPSLRVHHFPRRSTLLCLILCRLERRCSEDSCGARRGAWGLFPSLSFVSQRLASKRVELRLISHAAALLVHLPIYLVGKWSLRFSDLEEDHAQNKVSPASSRPHVLCLTRIAYSQIALSLILGMVTYSTLFVIAWFSLFLSPLGAIGAMLIVWLFAVYHDTLIDDNCESHSIPISTPSDLVPRRQQVQDSSRVVAGPSRDLGTSRQVRSCLCHQSTTRRAPQLG